MLIKNNLYASSAPIFEPHSPSSPADEDLENHSHSTGDRSFSHLPLIENKDISSLLAPRVKPIFKEPTISDMIAKAEMFCKDKEAGKINIKTTHLPYLVNDIQYNFYTLFPEEELYLHPPEMQKDILAFKEEMEDRIQTKTLTYEWWVYFNYRLSILATPYDELSFFSTPPRYPDGFSLKTFNEFIEDRLSMLKLIKEGAWKSHDATIAHLKIPNINLHPNYHSFLFPTTKGNLSIEDMNTMLGTKVWAVGLTNKPVAADGNIMWPAEFFTHDLRHELEEAKYLIDPKTREKIANLKEKLSKLKDILQFSLELEPKKAAALIKLLDFTFFYIQHETGEGGVLQLESVYEDQNSSSLFEPLSYILSILYNPLQTTDDFPFDPDSSAIARSDWYKEALPDPEELGFLSSQQMCELGLEVMNLLLPLDSPLSTETISNDINNIFNKFASSPKTKNTTTKIRYSLDPQFLLSHSAKTLYANQTQTNLYNKVINCINSQNFSEAEKQYSKIREIDPKLANLMRNKGIDKIFPHLPNQKESLGTLKVTRLMDAIDNTYLA